MKCLKAGNVYLMFVVFLLAFAFFPSDASAWCNSSYTYRVPININTATNLTNYQIPINLTYDSDMNANFTDLLFCDKNDVQRPFWIESQVNGSWSYVWVNASVNTTNGTQGYFYFNNPTATSQSNGTAVFRQFHSNASASFSDPKIIAPTNFVYEGSIRRTSTGTYDMSFGLENESSGWLTSSGVAYNFWNVDNRLFTWNSSTYNTLSLGFSGVQNQFYKVKIMYGSSGNITYYRDNVLIYNGFSTYLPNKNMGLYFNTVSGTGGQAYSFVRTYAATEPTVSIGAKELNGILVLNVSAFNNQTGASLTNWQINITNGTTNFSAINQNNPALFYNTTMNMTGNSNVTISDGSTTLYFYNQTFAGNINSTLAWNLNATLQPKSNNPISLLSSGGWTLTEGAITTLTCTVGESPTMGFWINGVAVGSPYTLTTAKGTYSVTCGAQTETANYAPINTTNTLTVNSLFACTKSSIYAFNALIPTTSNQTTLNFTDLANQSYVRKNLGDVLVNNVNQTWINTTGGYYVVVNNTGVSTLNVSFGNYYANNSYSTSARLGNVSAISSYSQINPFVEYNILDELSSAYFFPPNATMTSIISCSSGDTYITIAQNDTKFIIATAEPTEKATARVLYTSSTYYSRQLYTASADVLRLNFYVTDAFVNPLDRIDFLVQDMALYNSKIQVYKTISGNAIIITEGYFDTSHYFSAYLLEDIDYSLRTIDADGTITELGRMTVEAPATKTIGQVTMSLSPQATLIADKVLMNAWTNEARTILYVRFNDETNLTTQLNITVKYQNGTVFQALTYANTSSVDLNYDITPFANQSFTSYFSFSHPIFGNSPVQHAVTSWANIFWDLGIDTFWYRLISLSILISVGGLTSRKNLLAGSAIFLILMMVFIKIGWMALPWYSVVFVGVLFFVGIAVYHKQSGE